MGASEEAATLHQLAVAAMSSKPARLDEASALLREALALQAQDSSAAIGGRAATLQQLARVAERRGDHGSALAHLQETLELHKRAYGEGTPHVNKAAVLSQVRWVHAKREPDGELQNAPSGSTFLASRVGLPCNPNAPLYPPSDRWRGSRAPLNPLSAPSQPPLSPLSTPSQPLCPRRRHSDATTPCSSLFHP